MIRLITGGSGSGKSEYAENIILEDKACLEQSGIDVDLFYIATMNTEGMSAQRRIEKHRKQRSGKGFTTIESMFLLENDLGPLKNEKKKIILLEDVSNLLANYMFSDETNNEDSETIVNRILDLSKYSDNIVIVTNEIFGDSIRYDESMQKYISTFASINASLAKAADSFIEVIYGYPFRI